MSNLLGRFGSWAGENFSLAAGRQCGSSESGSNHCQSGRRRPWPMKWSQIRPLKSLTRSDLGLFPLPGQKLSWNIEILRNSYVMVSYWGLRKSINVDLMISKCSGGDIYNLLSVSGELSNDNSARSHANNFPSHDNVPKIRHFLGKFLQLRTHQNIFHSRRAASIWS